MSQTNPASPVRINAMRQPAPSPRRFATNGMRAAKGNAASGITTYGATVAPTVEPIV